MSSIFFGVRFWLSEFIAFARERIDYIRYRLSPEDLSEIYTLLSQVLEQTGVNLRKVLLDVAYARELEGNKKAYVAYSTIAGDVRNPRTKTPIADAFRQFIPPEDYESMRRAELSRQLAKTLRYIQIESNVRNRIKKINRNSRLFWSFRVILPIAALYPNIDWFMPFLHPRYGEDKWSSFYRFWHEVDQTSTTLVMIFAFLTVCYGVFFALYRYSYATEIRRFFEYMPFFKGFKQMEACTTLINVTIAIRNATGIPVPKTIKTVASYSNQYIAAYLEELSDMVARTSLRDAISSNNLFPRQLRGILVLRLAIPGAQNDLLKPVEEAIFKMADLSEKKAELSKKLASYLNMMILLIPPCAAMMEAMGDTPF
jgi:hypothetical protein